MNGPSNQQLTNSRSKAARARAVRACKSRQQITAEAVARALVCRRARAKQNRTAGRIKSAGAARQVIHHQQQVRKPITAVEPNQCVRVCSSKYTGVFNLQERRCTNKHNKVCVQGMCGVKGNGVCRTTTRRHTHII